MTDVHDLDLDVDFDMRTDVGPGQDPDARSLKLRSYHQALWSKELPSGRMFDLTPKPKTRNGLVHESDIGPFLLSSDTIGTAHRMRLSSLYSQLSPEENEAFHRRAYTIAGFLVFPMGRSRSSINTVRGMNSLVSDRLDLTLESIRRHYEGGQSPLTAKLDEYGDFFDAFGSFAGYIDFFHLGDAVTHDGSVDFFFDFDDFRTQRLPRELDEYIEYRRRMLVFLDARRSRIQRAWEER